MRIIFLNTWYGKLKDFSEYITKQIPHTDVFCFQEVGDEIKIKCNSILPNYLLLSGYKEITKDNYFSLAVYVKHDIKLVKQSLVIEKLKNTGLGIYAEIEKDGSRIHLCNFHGIAYPGDKKDNGSRIVQSKGVIDFFKNISGSKIIGGDFNLAKDAESIKVFEKNGYRNLINEYKVHSTRNKFAWKKYPNVPQNYSDYVFVDKDIKVKKFFVPTDLVSDHQPLVLEIDV